MVSIDEHPGFMSYENGLFEVLHADWPIYPLGHGWKLGLETLGNFPQKTTFKPIDEIDRCLLFYVNGLLSTNDFFDEKCFHVALWHDDIVELSKREMVSGVIIKTEFEAMMEYHEEVKKRYYKKDEKFYNFFSTPPNSDDYDEDERNRIIVSIDSNGLRVTEVGYESLVDFDFDKPFELYFGIEERIKPLIAISRYDTAVRETNILIETRLREVTNTDSYGQNLINAYYKSICDRRGGKPSAFLKIFRTELRTIFKFIRNEYAHQFQNINSKQCYAILRRASKVLKTIDDIEKSDKRS